MIENKTYYPDIFYPKKKRLCKSKEIKIYRLTKAEEIHSH